LVFGVEIANPFVAFRRQFLPFSHCGYYTRII
jgi:hypothetical protein